MPEPYEKLKDFTRGRAVTRDSMQDFVASLEGIPEAAKRSLQQLTPATYVGNAGQQAMDLRRHLQEL